jgi:hypothetical protein
VTSDHHTTSLRRAAALLLALCLAAPAAAEEAADEALFQASQNPASNIVAIPVRNETSFGIGHKRRTGNTTAVEPFFPTAISDAFILAHRIRLALVWQPEVNARIGGSFGMGDLGYELYLAQANPGPVTWGAGAAVLLPTGTDDRISEHKWTSGPAAAVSGTVGRLVLGIAGRQLWTWASTGSYPVVNRLTLEPQASLALRGGWFLVTAPVITADWKRAGADVWTVPLGGGVAKLVSPGGQKILLSLQGYGTAVHPRTNYPEWTLRAGASFLFPR